MFPLKQEQFSVSLAGDGKINGVDFPKITKEPFDKSYTSNSLAKTILMRFNWVR